MPDGMVDSKLLGPRKSLATWCQLEGQVFIETILAMLEFQAQPLPTSTSIHLSLLT